MQYFDVQYDINESKINKVYMRNAVNKGDFTEILDCSSFELSFKKLIQVIYNYLNDNNVEFETYGVMLTAYKDGDFNDLKDIKTTNHNAICKIFRVIVLDTSNYLPDSSSKLWIIPYPYVPPKRNSDDPDIIPVEFDQE